ncbi:MAG: sugar transferase [Aggregatilineales bacterium]
MNPALLGWASTPRRVLIIGTGESARIITEVLTREAQRSYDVTGIIADSEKEVGTFIENIPVAGTGQDLLNFVSRDGISELVLTSTQLTGDMFQGVMDAYERGVTMTHMPILYERVTERVPVQYLDNSWMVVLPEGGVSVLNLYPFLKRLLDIILSVIGLFIFILMLPFIALAIRLDSRGSIFYSQVRVGLNGRHYKIIKFRTMVSDAEKLTGAVFAQKHDPRVTRVGRFLRLSRLDELPQLFNVIKGEMSLIGPRPERPEHVQRLQQKIPFYRTRHTIRPGVTGWAQVRYHYGATDEDSLVKLQYDLYYIRHRSLMLDLGILIRTAVKMIRLGGQ